MDDGGHRRAPTSRSHSIRKAIGTAATAAAIALSTVTLSAFTAIVIGGR
jgi:hypothetical protein